jgi:hypothetical protein
VLAVAQRNSSGVALVALDLLSCRAFDSMRAARSTANVDLDLVLTRQARRAATAADPTESEGESPLVPPSTTGFGIPCRGMPAP